ncbi:Flagellar biosynthesis protein FlhA [Caulifigura coniformis]|uniref:Flagellar biosynthesis protein FlhA n=1 Tax=Caulifigura coniformis TaxID=2527983 RepID=A0A517SJB8_9PLAN|nr:flagellar biosynthesis protein FlhA [Caulifigura coniformis]QDT56222.1 Flagellar biosynthesis protein FlhA [Caulifigura coniformis]
MSTPTSPTASRFLQSELLLAGGMLCILVVMLVPLPTALLDMLLAFNLGLTLLLLLITMSAKQPLDLSVFPSLLLLLTLYRLSLNVATTRLVLLDGDAGKIVETFGGMVVGGNLVVGLVIFLILIVIQFIVITKGSERVSEVSARFTLDALPGKQMAIDAEMNAGAINEAEARKRRELLGREMEFYGSMDGASKFVRGDAIAGLIITAINLFGGAILGVSRGMSVGESIHTYSVLSIGDGLISQIPALIVATTAGILVTKNSSEANLGQEIGKQLFSNDRPLWMAAGMFLLLGMVPGLPKIPFVLLTVGVIWHIRRLRRPAPVKPAASAEPALPPTPEFDEKRQLEEFLVQDRAVVEVGARLIPLVNPKRARGIADRITSLRRDFAKSNGIWIPPIRIRDNLELGPEEYRVVIAGREAARKTLRVDLMLAIAPEAATVAIPGEETTDPAFGMPAKWIEPAIQRQAEFSGYTVVDPASVLITHLGEILKRHGSELLSREDVRKMLDKVKEQAPTIVEELKPDVVRMGTLHQVLVQLAAERVPLSDLVLILESIANHGTTTKAPDDLLDKVREDIGRIICGRFCDDTARLQVIVLEPRLEARLRESLHEGQLALDGKRLEKLLEEIGEHWRSAARQRIEVALIMDRRLRRPLRKLLTRALPDLGTLSYTEVPADIMLNPVGMARFAAVFDEPAVDESRAGQRTAAAAA